MPATPEVASSRRLAWLYASPAQRPVFAALGAIENEIRASLDPRLDHQVAHTRLAWWREECARCSSGAAHHPLTRELCARFGAQAAPLAGLGGAVDLALWDLAAAPFATRRELTGYCERWSAAFFEPLARFALPAAEPDKFRVLGGALCELEMLQALASEARAGRVRLPLDELAQAQSTPGELAQPPWAAGLAALVRTRHQRRRAELAAGVAGLAAQEQAAVRGLLVWVALAMRQSQRAERALPQAPLSREDHAPLDAWRAWRIARAAEAGRLALTP